MLLTWIAEVADEPLLLEPADRRMERETNTWRLGADDEDRRASSVAEVVTAFERTAAALRVRIRELCFPGPATFYVWHDQQAGQLRCSTCSLSPDALPFGGAYTVSDDLSPIVAEFLADSEPGVVAWSDLHEDARWEQACTEPEKAPLRVWVSRVGAASH
ncbi:hypothetical protein ACFYYB_42090 [Streptomyces sp. NPDC002886]|uniref:hypothetical protein n=1 Tax=Streptomyces sp. NPDC002886 TaxID=3364667 RepID=UPI0036CC58AC